MNCLKRLLVGVESRARAGPYAGVALGLASGGVGVPKSVSEELELLEQVDLLESSLVRLWVMLWAVTPRRGPRQRNEGAIIHMMESSREQRAEFFVFYMGWLNRWWSF